MMGRLEGDGGAYDVSRMSACVGIRPRLRSDESTICPRPERDVCVGDPVAAAIACGGRVGRRRSGAALPVDGQNAIEARNCRIWVVPAQ